jgi:segregation and condensation protein B
LCNTSIINRFIFSFLPNCLFSLSVRKTGKQNSNLEQLSQHIESLIFTSQGPITFEEVKAALEDNFETKFKKVDIQSAIDEVLEKYKSDVFSFEIVEIANGYQFFTKGAFHGTVGSRLKLTSKKRLSKAALETLSVIAYKQPVTKSECEKIRGVSCDYTIQKLLEKELVSITGRDETPGRPLLYATSQKFMDYFGLKDISELPKPKDFQLPDQEIGDAAPIEELSEEQREQKTVALETMTDQVAAAILGEEFFPQPVVEEDEEAAVDDEPEDKASGAPIVVGENVSAMSEEEAAALLAEDALIETAEEEGEEEGDDGEIDELESDEVFDSKFGEEVDAIAAMQAALPVGAKREEEDGEEEGNEEEVDEAEEAMVSELEEELKEIREEEGSDEEVLLDELESDDLSENKFEEEVDAIAAMQEALPLGEEIEEEDGEGNEEEVDEAEEALVSELEEELKEIREEEGNDEEVLLDELESDEVVEEIEKVIEEIARPIIVIPSEHTEVRGKVSYDLSFENEVDAIAAMLDALPQRKMVIGLPEEELLTSQPILDKIIEDEVIEEELEDSATKDISLGGLDDSAKKKL